MKSIEAVIFDWGGVLIDNPAQAMAYYCAAALDVDIEQYLRAFRKYDDDFITGKINEDRFWLKVCYELGKEKPQVPSLWTLAFEAAYNQREDMFNLAVILRENGYLAAVLSNTEPPAAKLFYKNHYDKIFDAAIFSCNEGVKKPQLKIYDITASKLSVLPANCVFIDDDPQNIDGAKKAGMNAILFKSVEQIKMELSKLGIIPD